MIKYRLDHHLEMGLILGHFEEGGSDLSVSFGNYFSYNSFEEGAVLVKVRRRLLLLLLLLLRLRQQRCGRLLVMWPFAPLLYSFLLYSCRRHRRRRRRRRCRRPVITC